MAYTEMRKLAKSDQRFGPTPADVERSSLMLDILHLPAFPPPGPDPVSFKPNDPLAPKDVYAPFRVERPATAAELFEKKKLRPKTERQMAREQWEVPGLSNLVNPPPRPVVTAIEAKKRFKAVTAGPFATSKF
jgi:hypothetical protein